MRTASREEGGRMSIIGTLEALIDREPWQDQALCGQTDPEAFFVEKGGNTKPGESDLRALPGHSRVPRIRPCTPRAVRHLRRPEPAGTRQTQEAGVMAYEYSDEEWAWYTGAEAAEVVE
jgi:hypothetical protein